MRRSLLNQSPKRDSVNSQIYVELQDDIMSNQQAKRQFSKSVQKRQRFLKLCCLAFLSSGFLYYRFMGNLNNDTHCILDAYQEYTLGINRLLIQGWDNAVLGIGQVIMDFWIISSAVFWMLKIQNFRFPFVVSTFYAVRSIFLIVEKFPFPEHLIWHNPGFWSLSVFYDHTRDFFYSGHTGALTIILLQFSQLTVKKSKTFAGYIWVLVFICLVYIMNMLIIVRVHYTVDIIGGLVFSVYFYWLIGQYIVLLDKIASLPYVFIISPFIQKLKLKRKKPQDNEKTQNDNQVDFQRDLKDQLAQPDQIENPTNPKQPS